MTTGIATAPRRATSWPTFSSRGPVGDFIKPDVTAPGLQILAGHDTPAPADTAAGPPGELFQAIAGTSMSCPHAAGPALVKAVHPTWTPGQIKSALMTRPTRTCVKEDGVTPADPFDAGAGSIRVQPRGQPALVFDETAADYAASAGDPLHRIDLNLPSINARRCPATITTNRTAEERHRSEPDAQGLNPAPAGVTITVAQPNKSPITVKAGQSVTSRSPSALRRSRTASIRPHHPTPNEQSANAGHHPGRFHQDGRER